MPDINFTVVLPLLFLTVWACLLLLVDLFVKQKGVTAFLAALGLALALGLTISQVGLTQTGFTSMVVLDGFSTFVNGLLLVSGLFGVALAYGYLKRMGLERGEYYTLLLFSIAGMMLMAQAGDLLIVFLALEMLSIPLYVLSAFARPQSNSEEAGLKYLLLGAFSTGFVVYGIALVFGATGTTGLSAIVKAAAAHTANPLLLTVGAALILVGLGFKVAAVPFHMWTPDVYQGAPSAVTAFMAAGAKIAGFAALLRVFAIAFPSLSADMTPILAVVSALTMIVGNVVAISQTNIKRLLAYSSIAHAGYIMMAFVPYGQKDVVATSVAAGLFYLVAYAITNFGAWAVVIALEKAEGKGLEISDYAGLGRKYPAAGCRHGDLPALAHRRPAHAGFRRQVLSLPRGRAGTVLSAGGYRRHHHPHLRLLLLARRRHHLHARRRARDHARALAQHHLGRRRCPHGHRQPRPAVPVRLGLRRSPKIVLIKISSHPGYCKGRTRTGPPFIVEIPCLALAFYPDHAPVI